MSNAEHRIKRIELARLLGGSEETAVVAADQRLRKYEVDGLVTPEIRSESPGALPFLQMGSANFDGGVKPHDASWEAHRSQGLPPLKTTFAAHLIAVPYYSVADAKLVAPHERAIAPLSEKFCQYAFGTDGDPAALPVSVSHGAALRSSESESTGAQEERTFRSTKEAIDDLDAMGFVASRGGSVAALFNKQARHPELFEGARKLGTELWWWEKLKTNFDQHGTRGRSGMKPRLMEVTGGRIVKGT